MTETRTYRERSYDTWEAMAPAWYREREFMWSVSHAVGERMVDALGPQPGQRILEIAAGVGDTGFMAAGRVGNKGGVISADFSPAMVDAARGRGSELGLENVEYRVMDAEHMDLPENSVDGALCRWGFMLMSDPARALAETRRVLRSGGRLVFSVWGEPAQNPWAAIAGSLMVERGLLEPPEPGTPGMFALCDRGRIRELVTGAGFDDPMVEEVEVVWPFGGFDDFWRLLTEVAGSTAMVINKLPAAEQAAFRKEVERRAAAFATGEGYEMPGLTLNVIAQ
jgi:SAM-dependent methyltransferase